MQVEDWRFLDLNLIQLEKLHGLEEALARSKKFKPTVIFWRASKPILTMGYFTKVEEKLNLKKCWEYGIKFVRRITGGSVGPLDPNIFSYSLIVEEKNPVIPESIEESYSLICGCLVDALKKIGLKANLSNLSDVLIDGKKVSGSAQARVWGKIIQHGFVYLDLDLETFKSLLNMEKLKEKILSLDKRVTWVNRELKKIGKKPLTFEEFKPYVEKAFVKNLNINFRDEPLTIYERKKANFYSKKFFMDDWNFNPNLHKIANVRFSFKTGKNLINISAYLENKTIKEILITSNFYPEKFFELSQNLKNVPADEKSIKPIVCKFFEENGLNRLNNVTVDAIVKVIMKALNSKQ